MDKRLHTWLSLALAALLLAGCGSSTTPVKPVIQPPATLAPTTPPPATQPPAVQPSPTAAPTSAPAATQPSPAATPTPPAAAGKDTAVTLTWWGQSTFVLTASTGLKALLDPTGSGTGYKIPTQDGIDLVTASHEHSDHNAVNLASGSPQVLKGLAGSDWAKIDQTVKGVKIHTVGTYHDDSNGSARGKNAIFVFDIGGLRVAHFGDLGHKLSPEQVTALGKVDVALIPVGGYYTIDAKTAAEVIVQVNPRVVVPMHYKTPDLAASLSGVLKPVDDFLKGMEGKAVVQETGQTTTISAAKLPEKLTILVMKYK